MNSIHQAIEDIILPFNTFADNKFIITGGMGLELMGVNCRNANDIDLVCTEPLTLNEFINIKDFFNCVSTYECGIDYELQHISASIQIDDVKETSPYDPEDELKRNLIQLKCKMFDHDIVNNIYSNIRRYKIDIFPQFSVKEEDIYYVDYEKHIIRVLHPSNALAFKAKLAFDHRIKEWTRDKHINDIQQHFKHLGRYNNNLNKLEIKQRYLKEMYLHKLEPDSNELFKLSQQVTHNELL